jgi:hypothetical protein
MAILKIFDSPCYDSKVISMGIWQKSLDHDKTYSLHEPDDWISGSCQPRWSSITNLAIAIAALV